MYQLLQALHTKVYHSPDLEFQTLHYVLMDAFVQLLIFFVALSVHHATYAALAGTEVLLQEQ